VSIIGRKKNQVKVNIKGEGKFDQDSRRRGVGSLNWVVFRV
jgi:hypothetical protein